jgi:hypothetical protein
MDVLRERKDTEGGPQLSLPRQRKVRTWAGQGNEASCDLCKHPIGAPDIEYEVELVMQSAVQVLRFHQTCHRNG